MCSLVEGAFDDQDDFISLSSDTDQSSSASQSTICQKCRVAESELTLRKKDRYCVPCFVASCNHKFRSTLGKHKVLKRDDSVLVAFDGSRECMSLMQLIHDSHTDVDNPKKATYTAKLIIVDDNPQKTPSLVQMAQSYPYDIHLTPVASALLSFEEDLPLYTPSDYTITASDYKVQSLLASLHDQTARLSLLKDLKRRIFVRAAQQLTCNKIFTGECATSLAITLLSGISSGKGSQLAFQAGFCDQRPPYPQVQLLRPLREFSIEEVDLYIQYCLKEVDPSRFNKATDGDDEDSINGLTRNFIMGLQQDFPSTVPTIFRTGDKLLQATDEVEQSCLLCQGRIDTDPSKENTKGCSALEATQFSHLVSAKGPEGLKPQHLTKEALLNLKLDQSNEDEDEDNTGPKSTTGGCCGGQGSCSDNQKAGCETEKKDQVPKRDILINLLCYSCRLIMEKTDSMPAFLVEEASKVTRRQAMKGEIQDFLL